MPDSFGRKTLSELIVESSGGTFSPKPQEETTASRVREKVRGPISKLAKDLDKFDATGNLTATVSGLAEVGKFGSDLLSLAVRFGRMQRDTFTLQPHEMIQANVHAPVEHQEAVNAIYDELDKAFEDKDSAEFGAFIGKWGPILYGSGLAMVGGKAMMMAAGPSLMKTAGQRAATNKLLPDVGRRIGQGIAGAGTGIESRAAQKAAGEFVTSAPYYERIMQAAGNAQGLGMFEFTRTLSQTGNTELAVEHGLFAAGAGLAIEGGLVTAGRALIPSLRAIPEKGRRTVTQATEKANKIFKDVKDDILLGEKESIQLRSRDGKPIIKAGGVNTIDFVARGEKALQDLATQGALKIAPGFAEATKKLSLDQRTARLKKYFRSHDQGRAHKDQLAKDFGVVDPRFNKILESKVASDKVKTEAKKLLAERRAPFNKAVDKLSKSEEELGTAVSSITSLENSIAQTVNGRLTWNTTPISTREVLRQSRTLGDQLKARAKSEREVLGFQLPTTAAKRVANTVNQGHLGLYTNLTEGILLNWAKSPGSVARQLGMSGLKFVGEFQEAEVIARPWKAKLFQEWRNGSDEIAGILEKQGRKFTKKQLRNSEHLNEIRDVYEPFGNGLEAVEAKFGSEVARVWGRMAVKPTNQLGQTTQKMGVNSMTSQAEQEILGANYVPQVVKKVTSYSKLDDGIGDSLRTRSGKGRGGMSEAEIQEFIASGDWHQVGARKFGTIDMQRKLPGTTKQKIDGTYGSGDRVSKGIPLEGNVTEAYLSHFDASITRITMGQKFGPNFELGTFYKAAMTDEGASETAAHWLVDSVLFNRGTDLQWVKFASNLNAYQTITKLTWATLPNAFQTNMTATRFGLVNTRKGIAATSQDLASNIKLLKAYKETLQTADKADIANQMGMIEEAILGVKVAMEGGAPRTVAERVAARSLRVTGFTQTERINRSIAAHAGLAHARDVIEGIASGRLRGQNLVVARRSLDSLGVNIDMVLARAKKTGKLGLSKNESGLVTTNAIKQTQFSTGVLDVPPGWRTPRGRIFMQFKSFAFNAGKMTKDQIFREAELGNYRPILYYMALANMSGEMINTIKPVIQGRERDVPDGLMRVVDNLSVQGGLGLAMSMTEGLLYQRGAETALGPTVSDTLGFGESVVASASKGTPEPMFRFFARQPLFSALGRGYQLGRGALSASADALDDFWDFTPQETVEEPSGPISQSELLRRMKEESLK